MRPARRLVELLGPLRGSISLEIAARLPDLLNSLKPFLEQLAFIAVLNWILPCQSRAVLMRLVRFPFVSK